MKEGEAATWCALQHVGVTSLWFRV